MFDTEILKHLVDRDDRRLTFIHQSLQEIDEGLRAQGSKLVVLHGNPVDEIPKFASKWGAQVIYTARDYDPYAIERDRVVAQKVKEDGRNFRSVRDIVILEPDEVRNDQGGTYRVYTPFSKAWRARFKPSEHAAEYVPDLSKVASVQSIEGFGIPLDLGHVGFEKTTIAFPGGESNAKNCLNAFKSKLKNYHTDRDRPDLWGVSAISPHLRFGTISIREAVRAALEDGSQGADKWLAELIWREFYQAILYHNPEVVSTTFNPQYADLQYPGTDELFEIWCEGKTGYPIVDAAMRSFKATGWMHNRLRMIVASFLTKDLLVDYRKGEAWFARYLLDFELASNNGGWQWASSTGCDAQPYFRIFNPMLQSKKFDPEGKFIREWIPEIATLPTELLHCPSDNPIACAAAGVELGKTYPRPVVDHAVQRELAIQLMKRDPS